MMIVLLLAIVSLLSLVPRSLSQNLLELDSLNLQEAALANDYLLVAFITNWCMHCSSLIEELRLASLELATKQSNANIRIGIIDIGKEPNRDLVNSEHIKHVPVIYLYKFGIKGKEYLGPRKSKEIVAYIEKKSTQLISVLKSWEELMTTIKHHENIYQESLQLSDSSASSSNGLHQPGQDTNIDRVRGIAVRLFSYVPPGVRVPSHSAFNKATLMASEDLDMYTFFTINDSNNNSDFNHIRKKFNLNADECGLALFLLGKDINRPLLYRFTSSTNSQEIVNKLVSLIIPNVLPFSDATRSIIKSLPVKRHVMVFYEEDDSSTPLLWASVRGSADHFIGTYVFLKVPSTESYLCKIFSITTFPQILLVDMTNPLSMLRYKFSSLLIPEYVSTTTSSSSSSSQQILENQEESSTHQQNKVVEHGADIFNSKHLSLFLTACLSPGEPIGVPIDILASVSTSSTLSPNRATVVIKPHYRSQVPSVSGSPLDISGDELTDVIDHVGHSFDLQIQNKINEMVDNGWAIDRNSVIEACEDGLLVLYAYAPWCSFCKGFDSLFMELSKMNFEADKKSDNRNRNTGDPVNFSKMDRKVMYHRIDGSENDIRTSYPNLNPDVYDRIRISSSPNLIGVRGYPSVFAIYYNRSYLMSGDDSSYNSVGGNVQVTEYEGDYSIKGLTTFISSHLDVKLYNPSSPNINGGGSGSVSSVSNSHTTASLSMNSVGHDIVDLSSAGSGDSDSNSERGDINSNEDIEIEVNSNGNTMH